MKSRHAENVAFPVAVALATLALVEVGLRAIDVRWLPPPSAVFSAALEIEELGPTLLDSGRTLGAGLAVTLGTAAVLTSLMVTSKLLRDSLTAYVDLLLVLPKIALVPALTLIWGFTDTTRVATIVLYALGPVVATWTAALAIAPAPLLEMARSFSATRVQEFTTVRLPAGAPGLLAGARLGVLQGLKGLVTAEVLIGVVGVGRLLKSAASSFQIESVYAVVSVIMVSAVVAYLLLRAIETRLTAWADN